MYKGSDRIERNPGDGAQQRLVILRPLRQGGRSMSPGRSGHNGARNRRRHTRARHDPRRFGRANYDKVLPVSVQDFDLAGSSARQYFTCFRFRPPQGQRLLSRDVWRDAPGRPEESADERRPSSGSRRRLRRGTTPLEGFRMMRPNRQSLSDLLLCFCLENAEHRPGRNQQIQRVSPAHYMASWIDLADCSGEPSVRSRNDRRDARQSEGRLRRAEPGRLPHVVRGRPGIRRQRAAQGVPPGHGARGAARQPHGRSIRRGGDRSVSTSS